MKTHTTRAVRRLFSRTGRLSVRTRIRAVFLVSLLAFILLTSFFYWQILNQTAHQQLLLGARQSSDLLISSIRSGITDARNIGNILLLNADIIRWLTADDQVNDIRNTREANRILTQTYVTFPRIQSIYLFSNDGRGINATRHLAIKRYDDIWDTTWYRRAVALNGGSFVSLNADGTLFSSQNYNNVSLIRQILDISTFAPIGFLIINISDNFIADTTRSISNEYGTTFLILDENGASVVLGQEVPAWIGDILPGGEIRREEDSMHFLYRTEIPELGWTVVSSTPFRLIGDRMYEPLILLVPVLCAIGMYFLGSLLTINLISKPINELISSMQGVREGRFEPVPPSKRRDEFGQLNENYNIMIGALNATIQQRILLEKEKQRYELDILTEQFKPHFLYNTLDSISYLILSNCNQRAYEAIINLSRFYRTSLHHGLETVPLSQELDMIRNYLALQKLRYDEMIHDRYDIVPDAGQTPVLRNILQPLVENCIYHGIKPSGEPGQIAVKAWPQGDRIYIQVEDNGLGMTPETLAGLNNHAADQHALSFGLRGTIKRLSLFYGDEDICEITSALGSGTAVLIKLPGSKGGDPSHD